MERATLRQARKILEVFEDTPGEQLQALLGSGLLADLRNGNIAEVNRDAFRQLVGLPPLTPPLVEGIVPPLGGRVHVVSVPVNESRLWGEAVSAAGPDTVLSRDIWRAGDQYPVAGAPAGPTLVILVSFGKVIQSWDVLAWGKEQHLRPASPRSVFAIAEYCPTLHLDLGMKAMAVVSLVPCSFEGMQRVPDVWLGRSERRASLIRFDYEWDDFYWFAFVRVGSGVLGV